MILYMKSIIKMLSINKTVLYQLLFLLLVVVVSLAIKQIYFNTKEGLLTSTMIIKIEEALENYETEVEEITTNTIKKIASAKLTQAESVSFSPILADEEIKNTAKIDKIIKLKPTSNTVKEILIDSTAKKYKASLMMLNKLNEESYTDDEAFTKLLENIIGSSYNVVSGDNSAHKQLRSYIDTISSVVPSDEPL